MKTSCAKLPSGRFSQFNMTALIDVVFLLIIFFMLICQFIGRENYELVVPDQCPAALVADDRNRGAVTVSVFTPDAAVRLAPSAVRPASPAGAASSLHPIARPVVYAVRSRRFDPADAAYDHDMNLLLADMSHAIARQTAAKPDALVNLRADRDLPYGQVQNALLALSRAGVKKVRLAAFREPQPRANQPHPLP